jgi:hypothetical protein
MEVAATREGEKEGLRGKAVECEISVMTAGWHGRLGGIGAPQG